MRIPVVSDIHANHEALCRVPDDVDHVLCLPRLERVAYDVEATVSALSLRPLTKQTFESLARLLRSEEGVEESGPSQGRHSKKPYG